MRHAPLALLLVTTLALAGCTMPWQSTGPEDNVGGDYESGVGASLTVKNEAEHAVNATLRLVRDGKEVARDSMILESGQTMVRRYALPGHGTVTAQLLYSYDAGGRAASGEDTHEIATINCEQLTQVKWAVIAFPGGIGSRYDGTSCATADG